MESAEQVQTSEMCEQYLFDLAVDKDTLFSNHKNVYKKRIEKRQTKLLEKISFIQPFLQEDERILLVTTGCSPITVLEQLLMGWIVFHLKRAVFVFTDRRIFHIPTKPNYSYRHSIAHILYSDCQSIALKGKTIVAKYKSGQKEKFYYIASKERRKAKTLLQNISVEGTPSQTQQRMHLCPSCTS